MALSGIIEFHASSGAPCHPLQIDHFVAGSGLGYNRIGLFGTGGPGTYVQVNLFQDTTYIVNESGAPSGSALASGKLTNLKYINSSSVNPNSSGSVSVSGITERDSTLRIRFTHPSGQTCTLQNCKFIGINLNASSGAIDETTNISGINIYAFEVGRDTSWTKISNDASLNYLSFANRSSGAIVHDYHLGLSASPLAVGERKNFAFIAKFEFV